MANFRIAGVLFGSTLIGLLNIGSARATEERLGKVDFQLPTVWEGGILPA